MLNIRVSNHNPGMINEDEVSCEELGLIVSGVRDASDAERLSINVCKEILPRTRKLLGTFAKRLKAIIC